MKDDHHLLTGNACLLMTYGTVSWDRGPEIFDREQLSTAETSYNAIMPGKNLQVWLTEALSFRSKNNGPDKPEITIFRERKNRWLVTEKYSSRTPLS